MTFLSVIANNLTIWKKQAAYLQSNHSRDVFLLFSALIFRVKFENEMSLTAGLSIPITSR